jgi:hypothetical protein
MSSVAEIEHAISKLSRGAFVELERWFDEERNRKWDQQIEADSESGALDFLLREVEEDIARGRTRPTDELCDKPSISKGLGGAP